MDPQKKQQPTAPAAAEAAKPTTLLDAYEVECIRREIERHLLRHNADDDGADASSHAMMETQYRRRQHHRSSKKTSGAKNANPAPAPAPRAKKGPGGGARLLGRHAVAICSGTGHGLRRRGGYREVEKV